MKIAGMVVSMALLSGAAFAQGTSATEPRVILKGYDPVAYFTEHKPVKGTPGIREDFDGARYYFAIAQNRTAFSADPDRYIPQFAGNCAVSIGMNKRVEADPTQWKIVDGKLYVFGSARALDMAAKDPALLQQAQKNWQAMK